MKLVYIKSTMEPKNYSAIRSILKQEQGEKIAPYVFKLSDTKAIQEYLNTEKITYEIYQQSYVNSNRSINTTYQEDISGRSQQGLNSKKRELPETSEEPRKNEKYRVRYIEIFLYIFKYIVQKKFYKTRQTVHKIVLW